MNCEECLLIVEEYVEKSLDPQASDQTAAHISACEKCRIVYEELKNEQEIYSRYLLKIKENPQSWNAVRREIRKGSRVTATNAGTVSPGFYERFSAVFSRPPLLGTIAVLVLLIGLAVGLWYSTNVQNGEPGFGVASSEKSSLNEKKNDRPAPDSSIPKDVQVASAGSQILMDNEGGKASTTRSVRPGNKKKRSESINFVAEKINESQPPVDLSEAAFNRHIEKCEMVLRSFRNVVPNMEEFRFDISYERRMAKELLSNSVSFRREAQSQGNLPIENLLVDLEAILSDISKLHPKAASSETRVIRARIQESGIIARLQIQSSIAEALD